MQYARHKSILKIMRKLAELDEEIAKYLADKIALQVPNVKSQQGSSLGAARQSDNLKTDNGSPILSRSEKKMAKKAAGVLDSASRRQEVELFSQNDTNFISAAIHLAISKGKGAWEGKNTCDAFSHQDEPTQIDDEAESEAKSFVNAIDSLSLKPTATNSKQKRNAKKLLAVEKARHVRGNMKGYSPKKPTQDDLIEGLDPQIFLRLGIKNIDPPKSSAVRKELIRKLTAVIKEDLAIQAQEKAEAKIREESFWRWAGRGAYNLIMKNREGIDWATGVKRSSNNWRTRLQGLGPQAPGEIIEAEDDIEGGNPADDDALPNDDPLDDAPLEANPAAN